MKTTKQIQLESIEILKQILHKMKQDPKSIETDFCDECLNIFGKNTYFSLAKMFDACVYAVLGKQNFYLSHSETIKVIEFMILRIEKEFSIQQNNLN